MLMNKRKMGNGRSTWKKVENAQRLVRRGKIPPEEHPRKVNMFEDKRSENGYFLDLRGATRSKNLCLADD